MEITVFGWGIIIFLLISVWITRRMLRRYGRPLGCIGVIWLYVFVAVIGSFVAIFLPIGFTYIFLTPDRNVIMLVGIIFMLTILLSMYYGILKYAFGGNMLSWFINVRKFGLLILVPAMMAAFDALLVYAFFYGDNVEAWWIKGILGFFIFMLTLAIPGYLKGMWSNYRAGGFEPTEEAVKREQERQMKKQSSGKLFN